MLARRALQGLARPLTRLSSSSTPVPAHEVPTPPAVPQSPNFANTWSTSQRPRPQQHSSPRFEQTMMELQPNPLSAMEMINKEPIRVVHGRKAVCDGGASRSPLPAGAYSFRSQEAALLVIQRSSLTW